ncbi:GH32 C-terminal domain-containing protein [uncultured Bacteroides sp.]|uniref:GH32 C-terminal domain-containing protein n=1 Tax=uncultured Bacteroides sp. TaxID=162156 RepID=UPI002AAAFA8C|nr:GH32 C-terminal domain-containing protein [uncultured Bacteroides sp.]
MLTFVAIFAILQVHANDGKLIIKHLGDKQSIIHLNTFGKYLLLPIEEKSGEAKLYVISNNDVVKTINIHLATDKVDYYVPLDLSLYDSESLLFNIQQVPDSAICWKMFQLSNTFDAKNSEQYRPLYHFTPLYGWMNDPNGMVYKDGTYHLFYQYNPYGSMWGNMHWGHAISKDLMTWKNLPVAIEPDGLGAIFSGSCVVDVDNTSGFGKGAIVAFYTSAGERQTQSMAYSLDDGLTFKKYDRNPILTSTIRDFRDPKVIWHKASNKWIMVLAAGQEIQFYSSTNLKDWVYESNFGEGQGAHTGVWECPDLVEIPIEGTTATKWVLICNLNPGGIFGGSATQYFVGSFDGKKFINESPAKTKWMDWGKDHYATVTWSNAPHGRKIALAWMSNWDYANNLPTNQYRGAFTIPRELSLYTYEGDTYLCSAPVEEVLALREATSKKKRFRVKALQPIKQLHLNNWGAYELELKIKNIDSNIMGFYLQNSKGEKVDIKYSLNEGKLIMDRRYSGKVDFSKTFATSTWAPIHNEGKEYSLRIFVDKSSIEIFDGNGKFVMTNLVFPSEPYNSINFYTEGGSYSVTSFTTYKLGLKN